MTRKYKVLHVIDSFGLGGAQEVVLGLVKYRDRERFETEVAALHGKGPYYEKLRADFDAPVHSLSPRKWIPLYLPRLFGLLRRGAFDVVHCHLHASNAIAKPMAKLLGVPVRINHCHSHDRARPRSRAKRTFTRMGDRCATHVVAVSESVRAFLVECDGLPPSRVTTIHNGVDLDRFGAPTPAQRAEARARWGLPAEGIAIAGVGRLNAPRNFPLFLEVAARVIRKHPAVRFLIAGEGPERQALETLVRNHELSANVRLLGYVKDVAQLYPAVDIFLLTSRFEGTPMTVLEAMATRLPVVASRIDGIAEILEDEVDALLPTPGHPEGFVEAILRLVEETPTRERIARAAERKVRESYGARTLAKRMEDLYLKYLES